MKKFILLTSLTLLISCNDTPPSNNNNGLPATITQKNLDTEPPSDVQYVKSESKWDFKNKHIQIHLKRKGTGKPTKTDQMLNIHWKMTIANNGKRGETIFSTHETNTPYPAILSPQQMAPALLKILRGQHEGAELSALVPPNENIGSRNHPKIKKNDHIIFDFFILKAIDKNEAPEKPAIKDSDPEWKNVDGGIRLYHIKKGVGVKVRRNAYLTLHFTAWAPDGINKPARYSNKYNIPLKTIFGINNPRFPPHWKKVVKHLRAGDLVYARIPIKDKKTKKTNHFRALFEIIDVFDNEQLDKPKIKKHDDRWMQLPSGVQYIKLTEGEGHPMRRGGKISLHFSAWLEEGQLFASTLFSNMPYKFEMEKEQTIEGLEEVCRYVREGDVVYARIPFHAAFGPKGTAIIPPKSNVFYKFTVLTIK